MARRRGADEGWRALDAEEGDLGLEHVGHLSASGLEVKREPLDDIPTDGAEPPTASLTNSLHRSPAGRFLRGVCDTHSVEE